MMNRSIFLHAITAALAVGANHATPNPFSLTNPATADLGRERANRSAHRNSGAAAVQRAAKKRRNAKKR